MPGFIHDHALTLAVVVPFVGSIVAMLIPGQRRTAIKGTMAVFGALSILLSFYIFLAYDYRKGGFQFQETYPWITSLGVQWHVGVDGISVLMVLLTGIVMFTGILISWNINTRTKDFFVLLLTLVTGVFGVFVTLDLFLLFFFYELAVLPMYLLIGVWGSSTDFKTFLRTKEYGAMKLTLYLVAGSVLVWVALIAVYAQANLGTFDLLALSKTNFSVEFQRIFFPFLAVGFGVLAGLWPFHTWSPDGHVAAPTAVSMLHAGVLMKLGAYGIVRVAMTLFPEGAQMWLPALIVLGTVNVVYGAISATAQRDLKYVIGYSSVSHMGYVLMGLATMQTAGVNGAVLQMFSHGIMTALFFALVGAIYDQAHVRDIGIFEGLAKRMGVTAAIFTVAGLTSLGLPGLSGFVAELLVFVGTFQTYPLLGVLGVIGAAITAVYILRLLAKVFFGPLDPRWQKLRNATRLELAAMGILVFFLVYVGVNPGPFLRIIESGVAPLVVRLGGLM
ncbi:MAG: NADH-quinone oxidoreductase subunit M [Chloroflexi bacterium]|nr:NADH-quinone oxidoreductase subunit M [Chloroflexota bacterium]